MLEMAGAKLKSEEPRADAIGWTFLTNHAHVFLCIAMDPAARMRDVAEKVGITERAAHRIVDDLEAAGYLSRTREGRRNRYDIRLDVPLRHPIERHRTVASLVALLKPERAGARRLR